MRPDDSQKRSSISVLMISAVLILGSTAGEVEGLGDSDRDRYSVGDTRIINMDLTGCYGMTLTVYKDASFVEATLYALSKPPSLTNRDTLNHSLASHDGKAFRSDFFYLYRYSNYSITACSSPAAQYKVYVIKGIQNFTAWKAEKRGKSVVTYTCPVNEDCSSQSQQPIPDCEPWPKTITADDDWYFATDAHVTGVAAQVFLQRYEYKVEDSAVLSSCVAGGSKPQSCTIAKTPDVSTYLLVIGPGDAGSIVEANTGCASKEGPNVGTIVSLTVFVVATIVLSFTVCIACRLIIKYKTGNENEEQKPLIDQTDHE